MDEPYVSRAGTKDPAEAPLVELSVSGKPYLLKVSGRYIKVLISGRASDDSGQPVIDEPVGSEGDYAAMDVQELRVGPDDASTSD